MINTNTLRQRLHASIPALSAMYNERHRSYHSLEHIHDLISNIVTGKYIQYLDPSKVADICESGRYLESIDDREIVLQTIAWFHDCYYDPYLGSPLNEITSVSIASSMLDGLEDEEYEKFQIAMDGIILTSRHLECVTDSYDKHQLESLIFMDLDMRSFSNEEEFIRNNQRVRDEYYKTSEIDYMQGREKFLTKLMEKKKIYYTFKDEFEEAARENISRALVEVRQFLNNYRT